MKEQPQAVPSRSDGVLPMDGMRPTKVVYFATGAPQVVAADLQRLRLKDNGVSLRVVAPAAVARQVEELGLLRREEVLCYKPSSAVSLWLRLWKFLGASGSVRIICLSDREHFRFLKLVAMTLRGQLTFSAGNGTHVSYSLVELLEVWGKSTWLWLRRIVAARGPVCVIGSASPDCLRQIVANLRQRFPEAKLYAVLPLSLDGDVEGLFDSVVQWKHPTLLAYFRLLPQCVGRGRFQRVVLPWTPERSAAWKWLGWLLPLWRVEIYNENIDAFSGRNVWLLARHWLWRSRLNRERRREDRERYRERRREDRERYRRTLPVGVIGSASALYLKKIVPVLRASFPGVPLHALLPPSLETPAEGLFDSVTILRPGVLPALQGAWRLGKARRAYQGWVIPCTIEPYHWMKLLAFCLPLTRRYIYNEQADGFPVRDLRMFCRHFRWRLRDHLLFQIVAGAAGKGLSLRVVHLFLYSLRLLAGMSLLFRARLRSYRLQGTGLRPDFRLSGPRVDLLVLGQQQDPRAVLDRPPLAKGTTVVRRVGIPAGFDLWERINAAIQNSDADFVCLVDGECAMSPANWLDRLLEMFDEHTAQVGPQIASLDGGTLIRELLLGSQGLEWNSNHAVRWHSRPEWLEVEALPWLCVVLRRSVFAQVGFFGESSNGKGLWVDTDFCRRLAAHGWRSLCNRNVTAVHPTAATVGGGEPWLVNQETRL